MKMITLYGGSFLIGWYMAGYMPLSQASLQSMVGVVALVFIVTFAWSMAVINLFRYLAERKS